MQIGVIGINHHSCSFSIREHLTRAFTKAFQKENAIFMDFSYVLLATCNRAEIYFSSKDLSLTHVKILSILRKFLPKNFECYLYSYFDTDAFLHLARVTSGLDSAILGESEIQKQVKLAYEEAKNMQILSSSLHFLFQKALRLGKYTRHDFHLYSERSHLSHILLDQIKLHMKPFSELSVLFIGNSDINRKILSIFSYRNFKKLSLCSRYEIEDVLKKKYEAASFLNYQVLENWQEFDVIISAGKNEEQVLPKIEKEIFEKKLLFDLCVPRSILPKIGAHPLVTLVNMERITAFSEKRQKVQRRELFSCEEGIREYVRKYFFSYHQKMLRKEAYFAKVRTHKSEEILEMQSHL